MPAVGIDLQLYRDAGLAWQAAAVPATALVHHAVVPTVCSSAGGAAAVPGKAAASPMGHMALPCKIARSCGESGCSSWGPETINPWIATDNPAAVSASGCNREHCGQMSAGE
jgi:hypothetical protein